MKLGILINTDKHLDHIVGITRAAGRKGHEVILFVMDAGTRLLRQAAFTRLCEVENATLSVCRHSAEAHEVDTSGVSLEIVIGSQFNNAMMLNQSDKVIVL